MKMLTEGGDVDGWYLVGKLDELNMSNLNPFLEQEQGHCL
jgi:hypothetical protein